MKTIGLIQAHHRGWGGARDFSLARVSGKYAVEEVITRLKSMPSISDVIIAVPDDPGNAIFRDIAAEQGVTCHFGSRENVLARCTSALDAAGADIAVHVMGQHCFIDTSLLADMLAFLQDSGASFVSLPDSFTPYFAGKIYTRALLDEVAGALMDEPDDRAINLARYVAFVEHRRERFGARVYEKLPEYDRDYLLKVREMAREIFADDRMHVDAGAASPVSNALFESYEFAGGQFGAEDSVLDIACGDGYGCRIMAPQVGRVLGVDINQPLIAANRENNKVDNISYDVGDCFALSLPNGAMTGATAMELIEHLPVDKVDDFIAEVRRVIQPGGSFICSTPQNSHGDIPLVPWHVKEYSVAELRAILERHFSSVKILSSKSGGRLSETCETGQKMVALCR
ncbi:MAG TPA: methyltransferase domain-containing protein [Rhizomicrobium sp.]|jgi:spore coat polysaccharide biosynthesis protein SpsF (cytidylyltransferase family)